MPERFLAMGNETVGWGALMAGCEAFFAYPITPQNEIGEWFAREYPKRGKVFFQATSETSAINMVFGAAAMGVRTMTSTSSPGWALMQETMSHLANAELPCVVTLVQRGGPGQGTTRQAQMDYLSVTRGGGQGGYKNISLCPASVQETHDFMQLAFYLADKYRNPVVVLSDGVMGMTMEPLELRTIDFGPLPEKDWAVRGLAQQKDGRKRLVTCTSGLIGAAPHATYLDFLAALDEKYKQIAESEVRCENYETDDAELVLVAYGYPSRACREAVNMARAEGLKVGLLRVVTAWPFPYKEVKKRAEQGAKFLVVEDSLGQLLDDVKMGVEGKAEVHLLGVLARHTPGEMGLIFPERILEEAKKLL